MNYPFKKHVSVTGYFLSPGLFSIPVVHVLQPSIKPFGGLAGGWEFYCRPAGQVADVDYSLLRHKHTRKCHPVIVNRWYRLRYRCRSGARDGQWEGHRER